MNQSLEQEVLGAMPAVAAVGLDISLCTIQQRSGAVSATGQVDLSNWVDIESLTGIPCQLSIQRPTIPNPNATERMPQQFNTQTMYHALLQGYYPQILQSNQAVVDGTAYEIMAVESDSQKQMTRMALRAYSL